MKIIYFILVFDIQFALFFLFLLFFCNNSYPLTDQDFKKSLGLGYADSGEKL